MIGFPAAAWVRGLAGILFAVAAGGLCRWVEGTGGAGAVTPATASASAARPPVAAGSGRTIDLRLESTFPVARWEVRLGDETVVAGHADRSAWAGSCTAATGDELLIRAEPEPAPSGAAVPLRAIQARLDGRTVGLFSGEPFVATLRVRELPAGRAAAHAGVVR